MPYEERLKRFQAWLAEQEGLYDAILISDAANIHYLSGFTGTFAYLLIAKNKAFILTDSRYTMQARQQSVHFTLVKLERFTPPMSIAKVCEQEGWAVLAFERNDLSFDFYDRLKSCFGRANLIPVEKAVEQFRAIKDAEEIELIRTAEHIGDAAFTHVLEMIRPGMTEKELAFELEFFMRREGASGLSFDTIVASGVRSAMPHGVASDKKIEKGDLVVFDFGCVYNGYCSDMTRTIGVGSLSDAQKDLYALVLKAQRAALKAARAGVVGEKMQDLVQATFDKAGFGSYFGHGLGHSVGLDIHEEPRFSRNVKEGIPAGTVISVEPGLYVPGIGGVRIEDLIVLTDDGYDNLTQSPKELLIV
ncbi:MAG: Xaa-Pro peptidase family protein [Peptococcaceae bacterium]|nr:Xaa-Pro peptidase family protein [Peptococcaceae bacterium]